MELLHTHNRRDILVPGFFRTTSEGMMTAQSRTVHVLSFLKVFIWAVIAIALVKFAFFPSTAADNAQSLNPSADYGQMTITPTRGDISNTVTAKGTIEQDPATTVKATGEGVVSYLYTGDGAAMTTGEPILELKKEIQGRDTQTADDEGNVTVVPGQPTYEYTTVYANASGTLRLTALLGQQFSIGDAVATIQPSTYSAVAALNAEQLYRIQNAPSEATLSITNGPAPFNCTGLQIVTPQSTTTNSSDKSQDSSSSSSSSSSIRAKCLVPADQTVFPGLQVTMDIVAGQSSDVLTLPISAVEGRFQSGYVYVPGDDGAEPVKKAITIGLTDGKMVEIVDGIDENQEVLEFIPTAKNDDDPLTGGGGLNDSANAFASTE